LEAWDVCLSVIESSAPVDKAQTIRSGREKAKAEIAWREAAPAAANPQTSAPAAPK